MFKILRKIRKFGLGYCDLETMIWNVGVMMRVMAINIDARNPKPPVIFKITTAILIAAYYYVYIISAGWTVFFRGWESNDLVTTVRIFALGVTSHIALSKLWFMYIYHGAVQKVVAEYLACDSKVEPGSRFSRNVKSTLRVVKRRALIFGFIIMFNAGIYLLMPFFTKGRHMPDDSLVFYGLEPMFESPNFEIARTLNVLAVTVTGYFPTPISGIFIIICGYTEAYMIALGKEVECLWDDALESHNCNKNETNETNEVDLNENEEINEFIRNRLEAVIKGHTININLIMKVEEIFSGSIAVGMITLIVGLIADLLGGLENTFIQMPYSLQFVGMDCLTGQRLIEANFIFERAVYASNWENFNVSNRKKVLLLLMNSQKTMNVSAGTITTLSSATFMSIIKSIYSAYTTLRSTMMDK